MRSRVLIIRAHAEGERLRHALALAGIDAFLTPLLTIEVGRECAMLGEALDELTPQDMVVATSRYAVRLANDWLSQRARLWPHCQYLAVGPGSADEWSAKDVRVGVPACHCSEGLLELASLQAERIVGRRVVLLRGQGGRDLLAKTLQERGAIVRPLAIYERHYLPLDPSVDLSQWSQWGINSVIITSGELLTHWMDVVPASWRHKLLDWRIIVLSSRLANMAHKMGFRRIITARNTSTEALIECLSEDTRI